MADSFQTSIALTAIHHIATIWLEAMVAANPRAKRQIERRHDEWILEMGPLAHEFAEWPEYQRSSFLGLLNGVSAMCERGQEDPEERNDLVRVALSLSHSSSCRGAGARGAPVLTFCMLQPTPDEVYESLEMHWKVRRSSPSLALRPRTPR